MTDGPVDAAAHPSAGVSVEEKRRLARELLLRRRRAERGRIPPADRAGPLPLSPQQEGLWLAERLVPGRPTYHVPVAMRLRGPLDLAALRAALSALVARHEALRTR